MMIARASPQTGTEGIRMSNLSVLLTFPSELNGTLVSSVQPLGRIPSEKLPWLCVVDDESVPALVRQSVVGASNPRTAPCATVIASALVPTDSSVPSGTAPQAASSEPARNPAQSVLIPRIFDLPI